MLKSILCVDDDPITLMLCKKVIVKGCGGEIPESAYMLITTKLQPVVQSLMFGEACSTVPVFKSKN